MVESLIVLIVVLALSSRGLHRRGLRRRAEVHCPVHGGSERVTFLHDVAFFTGFGRTRDVVACSRLGEGSCVGCAKLCALHDPIASARLKAS